MQTLSANASETLLFESSRQQTLLLELYSSQGCSSCPPAEYWTRSWLNKKALWRSFIPMVFHVDYWDHLGWEDTFASAEFSRRQSQYKSMGLSKAVYTPGFILNGKEWRGWFNGDPPKSSQRLVGTLRLELENTDLKASYSLSAGSEQLNIAILGFGFETYIRSGENQQKILPQDFVVLSYKRVDDLGGIWLSSIEQPRIKASRYALVAWVTEKEGLLPKQVLGGYLPYEIFDTMRLQ
jgi:hypothetical protein